MKEKLVKGKTVSQEIACYNIILINKSDNLLNLLELIMPNGKKKERSVVFHCMQCHIFELKINRCLFTLASLLYSALLNRQIKIKKGKSKRNGILGHGKSNKHKRKGNGSRVLFALLQFSFAITTLNTLNH